MSERILIAPIAATPTDGREPRAQPVSQAVSHNHCGSPWGKAMTDSLPLLLTVPEAAQLMRIGRDLAYALAARNEIPTIRLGRRVLVPRAALLRMLGADDQNVSGPSVPSDQDVNQREGTGQ